MSSLKCQTICLAIFVSFITIITIISLGLPWWFTLEGYKPLKTAKFLDWFSLTDLITWYDMIRDDAEDKGYSEQDTLSYWCADPNDDDDVPYFINSYRIQNEYCECGDECDNAKDFDPYFNDFCKGMDQIVAVCLFMLTSIIFGSLSLFVSYFDQTKSSRKKENTLVKIFQRGSTLVCQFVFLLLAVLFTLSLIYSLEDQIEVDEIQTRGAAFLLYIICFLDMFLIIYYYSYYRSTVDKIHKKQAQDFNNQAPPYPQQSQFVQQNAAQQGGQQQSGEQQRGTQQNISGNIMPQQNTFGNNMPQQNVQIQNISEQNIPIQNVKN